MKDHKHIKASSQPEYLVQQQMEHNLNQSYNKLLLALNINILAQVNQQFFTENSSNETQS